MADKTIGRLISEMAIEEYRSCAQVLDSLRARLGTEGLSMEEWNALVGAASDQRILAWRRERSMIAQFPMPEEERLTPL